MMILIVNFLEKLCFFYGFFKYFLLKVFSLITNIIFVTTEVRKKNSNFNKALRDVICIGLYSLYYYLNKDTQSIFYTLNNDLYMVNLDVPTSKGWNVAISTDST